MKKSALWPKLGSLLAVGFGVCLAPQVRAEVNVYTPSYGQTLEPGQTIELRFELDNNSSNDEFNREIEIHLGLDPDSPKMLIRSLPVAEYCDPNPPGTTSRPCRAMWQVPNVTCGDCRLQLVQIPGRGSYNSQGTTAVAIGMPYSFGATQPGSAAQGGAPSYAGLTDPPVPVLGEEPNLPVQSGKPSPDRPAGSASSGDASPSGADDAGVRCSVGTPGAGAVTGSTAPWLVAAAVAWGLRRSRQRR